MRRGTPSDCCHTDSNPSTGGGGGSGGGGGGGGGGGSGDGGGGNTVSVSGTTQIHPQPHQPDHHHNPQQPQSASNQMTQVSFVDDDSSCDSRWGKRFEENQEKSVERMRIKILNEELPKINSNFSDLSVSFKSGMSVEERE